MDECALLSKCPSYVVIYYKHLQYHLQHPGEAVYYLLTVVISLKIHKEVDH